MAHILVIDDDDAFRSVLVLTLIRNGHTVSEAHNGAQGLRLYRGCAADIVILDLIMPEKEGLETLSQLRQQQASAKIIAVSGGTARISPSDCLKLAKYFGAIQVLAKPFHSDVLLKIIDESLASTPTRLNGPSSISAAAGVFVLPTASACTPSE